MTEAFPLHLMRHGEPVLAGRMLGSTDDATTAGGVAACVGQAVGVPVERIISSDLRRAAECARAIDPGVRVDRRWREIDFGAWDGLAVEEIEQSPLWAFRADPEHAPPPGGERWSALCTRVGDALATLEPIPTLVISHAGAIRAALSVLCGFSYEQAWRIELPYGVLITLSVWPEAPRSAQIVAIRPCAG